MTIYYFANGSPGIDSLTVVPVSKAAARQRSGRAGREVRSRCPALNHTQMKERQVHEGRPFGRLTHCMRTQSAGECYRLYREESFLRFAESQVPEIKRYISASFEPLRARLLLTTNRVHPRVEQTWPALCFSSKRWAFKMSLDSTTWTLLHWTAVRVPLIDENGHCIA